MSGVKEEYALGHTDRERHRLTVQGKLINPLTIARQRCREAGHDNVRFEARAITELSPLEPYDAVIGRHILIHLADPLAALHKAVAFVRPGGLISSPMAGAFARKRG